MVDNSAGPINAGDIGALRRHPIWRDATDASIRELLRQGRQVRLRPGENLLTAGEEAQSIFLLLEGAVRVFYPAKGKDLEVTVKLFWAPAAFGDAESILRTRWAETVSALTGVVALVTPAARYFAILQREPGACFRQYWDLGRRFGVAIHSEKSANFNDISDRIIALLVSYAQHFGAPTPDGTGRLIDFALTQDDLATQAGAKRRSVVRTLTQLYRQDLVRKVERRYLIPDVSRLLAASSGSPDLSMETTDRPWAELNVHRSGAVHRSDHDGKS